MSRFSIGSLYAPYFGNPLKLLVINATNDWNTPCVTGQCSYDLPTNDPSSGTLKIWGSENAITDITPAADWQIIDCDPNALSQNIRLVCMNDDPTSLCGHLYRNTGAVNKLVRLPENCGANAFARVSKSWVPADQSIPSSINARIFRRDGTAPVVKALSIDTDFDAVDWTQNGKVNLGINAANVPGVATDIQVPGFRRSRRSRRGILGAKIGHTWISVLCTHNGPDVTLYRYRKSRGWGYLCLGRHNIGSGEHCHKWTNFITPVNLTFNMVLGAQRLPVRLDLPRPVSNAINATNNIGGDKTFTIKPITFDQSKNLFNTSNSCGPVTVSLSVDIAVNATVTPNLTITVAGTFVPPDITTFKAVADLTAQISGTLTLSAELTGHISSGKITVFQAGIPGLDFPGILTLGPTFEIDAELDGDVDLTMDLAVGLNLDMNNAQLTFPPDASTADSTLKLSASPSVQATGTLTAHLIPTLNFGISALGGKGQANLFAALDTSAALVLSLDASAQISTTVGNSTTSANSTTDTNSTAFAPVSSADATAAKATAVSATAIDATETGSAVAVKRADTTTSGSFGGCVAVNGGINVNAGATGDFFGLFDDTASVSLFTKNFQIFKKCFGDGASVTPAGTRRWMRRMSLRERQRRGAFSCPASDGTVDSSSITPL
ncbi:hypothetical protein C8R44DRAFT_741233 [Mycena epipterygia]|nr:hypothetical protein C8R44DRAFT_741233 [Mycena epipterygia]